jgi:hypothetical protein
MKKILGAVLFVGFLFRLGFLGTRQLWTDEILQALALRAESIPDLFRNLRLGIALPAPLDYLIQKGFVTVLGEAPWALRLHAAILGGLSLWLFYRVGRTLFGARPALYATALLAIYPLHQHYSQEAGPYSLLFFLTLASYDLLFQIISRQTGRSAATQWAALLFVDVLLLYSSILGAAVLVSQAAGLLITYFARENAADARDVLGGERPDLPAPSNSDLLMYAGVIALAFLVFVPWLLFAWAKPEVIPRSQLFSPRVLLVALKAFGDDSFPIAALIFAGAATGIRALSVHRRHLALRWLLAWMLVYIPVVWALDLWTGYFFATRQLVAAAPPLMLLIGYGLGYVGERLSILDRFPDGLSSPALVYAAVLLVASVSITLLHWRKVPAEWAGTAQYLKQNLREGDEVSAPKVDQLLEFHSPSIWNFRSAELDPGPGSLLGGVVKRRFVVCFNGTTPDPCGAFRPSASKNRSWIQKELPGFTIFTREAR